ncbi:MAG: DUF3737 family protein [Marinilabiliaceae bacterium]|nr:DUF3737 family protein [Marinilabiliaceae bacterium]
MQRIENKTFQGERPLYKIKDTLLSNIVIGEGESGIKECQHIQIENCVFEGKYPLWECHDMTIRNSHLSDGARAALWYSKDIVMENCQVDSPKTFRELDNLKLSNVTIRSATETLWFCRNIELLNVEIGEGDNLFLHSYGIRCNNIKLNGKYSFQYCKDIEITDSVILTKDAFWNTENVTIRNSRLKGEYLAWYSKNLHLINCHIEGTQPLCYAENLIIENCTFAPDADLAFEYSSVNATINGSITSVKNPSSGTIIANGIDEVIINEDKKGDAKCEIITTAQQLS